MKSVKAKQGISGGKATGAILTGGVSLLATGLSRKANLTRHTAALARRPGISPNASGLRSTRPGVGLAKRRHYCPSGPAVSCGTGSADSYYAPASGNWAFRDGRPPLTLRPRRSLDLFTPRLTGGLPNGSERPRRA